MKINDLFEDAGIDKFIIALRNHIGRAASQKVPAKLNWEAIGKMSTANGFEFAADYETFKSMYDSNPIIQKLVKNFNSHGVVLDVPGVSDGPQQTKKQTSKDEIGRIAAGAAEKNLKDSYNSQVTTEGHRVVAKTKDGETFKSKLFATAKEADTLHWKMAKGNKYSEVKVVKESKTVSERTGYTVRKKPEPHLTAIAQYQKKHGVSWDDAKAAIYEPINAKAKADAKAARPVKPRAPRPAKGMTTRQFEKACRGAAQDYMADARNDAKHGGPEPELDQVAWDMAGSMMYDKEIETYVRNTMARNSGRRPEQIRSEEIQDYITDEIYSQGTNESHVQEDSMPKKFDDVHIKSKNITGMVYAIKGNKVQVQTPKGLVVADISDLQIMGESVSESPAYEKGLDGTKPVRVTGIRGMKSSPFSKKFRSMAAYDRWLDSDAAIDHVVHRVMKESLSEAYVSEISKDLKQRYADKAGKVVKDVEPWTKKGEYKDLAKNTVAKRTAGIAKATEAAAPGKVKVSYRQKQNGPYNQVWFDSEDAAKKFLANVFKKGGAGSVKNESIREKAFDVCPDCGDAGGKADKNSDGKTTYRPCKNCGKYAKPQKKESQVDERMNETTDEMKSLILKAYNNSGKNKSKFIKLVQQSTGLTSAGLERTGYLKTLKFNEASVEESFTTKDYVTWAKNAKSRGLKVTSSTHPKTGAVPGSYFVAKDTEGNNRGYFDKSASTGVLEESVLAEAKKLACLGCDAVSSEAAWKKNGGTCPKCKKSSKGVAEATKTDNHLNIGGARVKNSEKDILKHVQKTFPNAKKVKNDPQHGWGPDNESSGAAKGRPAPSAARKIKSALESPDFGFTEEGGNGRVKAKGRNLVIYDSSYGVGLQDSLKKHIKKWSAGGEYYNYFQDELGVTFNVVNSGSDYQSRIFRGGAEVWVEIEVNNS